MTGAVDRDGRSTVLFIGGCGRSGSTLLDRMLGQLPGFCSVGELRFIWRRALAGNQLCGCGVAFADCPFWTEVGREAFGGWDTIDLEEVLHLQRALDRHRFIPLLLFPSGRESFQTDLERYESILGDLYRGIAKVSGASVIVDSTKDAPYAYLLRRCPKIDLRIVHLVRDSRGVAFSWTKHVSTPEIEGGRVQFMGRYSPVEMGARWVVFNLLFHLLSRLSVPTLFTRYERLVESPRLELERIFEHVGSELDERALGFVRDGEVELRADHTVSGNPMRFRNGAVPLTRDEEWRTNMSRGNQLLVSALTWPLLLRYGYLRREAEGELESLEPA